MTNLNILETFRTKEELINYFKEMGQTLTEKEIEALKQSYEQAEENNDALSLEQLDAVAGGIYFKVWENGEITLQAGKDFTGGVKRVLVFNEPGQTIPNNNSCLTCDSEIQKFYSLQDITGKKETIAACLKHKYHIGIRFNDEVLFIPTGQITGRNIEIQRKDKTYKINLEEAHTKYNKDDDFLRTLDEDEKKQFASLEGLIPWVGLEESPLTIQIES